ncbi:putative Lantibiotic biosynthesis protein dehydration domain-containing protein [Gammaproteobacteria bacterium]
MSISQDYLRQLAAAASTLDERMHGDGLSGDDSMPCDLVDARLGAWRRIVARGDDPCFNRRLRWDDLDRPSVQRLLGTIRLDENHPLPAWCATVTEIMTQASALASENPQRLCDPQPDEPIPFQPLLEVLLRVGRDHLARRLGKTQRHPEILSSLSRQANPALEHGLMCRLAHIGVRTLYQTFDQFRADRDTSMGCYEAFTIRLLGDGFNAFFCEFPVLARLWSLAIDQWAVSTAEFLVRLAVDWPCLVAKFDAPQQIQVAEIEPLLSDSHEGGRFVISLGFGDERGVVYKPRSLRLEAGFEQLLAWIARQDEQLCLRTPGVIDLGTHGWAERIGHEPCLDAEAVKRYYDRAGMLLCLVHLLEVTDLHWENLIASGEHPMLVDLETLLHPRKRLPAETGSGAEQVAWLRFVHSVRHTGLLPHRDDLGVCFCDSSGLGGVNDFDGTMQQSQWREINTDRMERAMVQGPLPRHGNRVMLDGVVIHPREYVNQVREGFERMYRFVIAHRDALLSPDGPLQPFKDGMARFVFRGTAAYGRVHQHALTPQLLRNGVDRSLAIEALSRIYLCDEDRPAIWPLFAAERRAMEQLDVPRFNVSTLSSDLVVDGMTLTGYFETSGHAAICAKIRATSEENLAFECLQIDASLYSPLAPTPDEGNHSRVEGGERAVQSDNGALIAAANQLADLLARRVIRGMDGSATWFELRTLAAEHRYQVMPISLSLGNGTAGVLLFLSALANLTRLSETCQSLLEGVRIHLRQQLKSEDYVRDVVPLGALDGRTSIVYGLTRAGLLLDDSTLIEKALRLVDSITPDDIGADRQFDVVGGAAGAILAVLPLLNLTGEARVRKFVMACGEHLLTHRRSSATGHRSWATLADRLLTGFSHGATGIALALARAAVATGTEAFFAAAEEAIAYESTCFDSEAGNWPDLRPDVENPFACTWCHGAPGIALARTLLLDVLDTQTVRHEIDRALMTTREYRRDEIDHLCCGGFGRAEVLMEVGRLLNRPALLDEGRTLIERILKRAETRGGFALRSGPLALVPNAGLFHGLSGIGYTLLRLVAPSRLPSVLTFA